MTIKVCLGLPETGWLMGVGGRVGGWTGWWTGG